jgi:hypothetical protein
VHMRGRMICPRCGEEGYLMKHRTAHNVYNYCRHVTWEGGKRYEKRCYLGPDEYINVEKLHDLELAGMTDSERWFRYVKRAIDQLKYEELVRLKEIVENRLKVLEKEKEVQPPEEIDAVAEWERAAQKESLEVGE